jgi:hypothetical protein
LPPGKEISTVHIYFRVNSMCIFIISEAGDGPGRSDIVQREYEKERRERTKGVQ